MDADTLYFEQMRPLFERGKKEPVVEKEVNVAHTESNTVLSVEEKQFPHPAEVLSAEITQATPVTLVLPESAVITSSARALSKTKDPLPKRILQRIWWTFLDYAAPMVVTAIILAVLSILWNDFMSSDMGFGEYINHLIERFRY